MIQSTLYLQPVFPSRLFSSLIRKSLLVLGVMVTLFLKLVSPFVTLCVFHFEKIKFLSSLY